MSASATPAPQDLILSVNSGSSSLKLGWFQHVGDEETLVLSGSADRIGRADGSIRLTGRDGRVLQERSGAGSSQGEALRLLLTEGHDVLSAVPTAIGHRVVHGGPRLREHQAITPDLLRELAAVEHFAPLHIPQALALIQEAQQFYPDVPSFACFDTAFHRTMPEVATHLPLPKTLFDSGVQRYGFHGLSYESLVHRLGDRLPQRAVFAHLGNGSSLCAVLAGQSVDTTMALTPTAGIPSATRSGDLDPGVFLFLMRSLHLHEDEIEDMLNHQAGTVALCGDSDMQAIVGRQQKGDAAASLALASYTTAVCKTIGAYAALLGGLDLLVFTGGIGEHSDYIRQIVCEPLGFLGLAENGVPTDRVLALGTEEEQQIARICRKLL